MFLYRPWLIVISVNVIEPEKRHRLFTKFLQFCAVCVRYLLKEIVRTIQNTESWHSQITSLCSVFSSCSILLQVSQTKQALKLMPFPPSAQHRRTSCPWWQQMNILDADTDFESVCQGSVINGGNLILSQQVFVCCQTETSIALKKAWGCIDWCVEVWLYQWEDYLLSRKSSLCCRSITF